MHYHNYTDKCTSTNHKTQTINHEMLTIHHWPSEMTPECLSLKKNIIKMFGIIFWFWGILSSISASQQQPVYQYRNGQWFDGNQFIKKEMYSVNGVWVDRAPAKIDSVIDLKDKFIIPPLSEAHTHSLDGIGNYTQTIASYLRDGVFYVKNPNSVKPWTDKIRGLVNVPGSLDATFSNGGLTCNGGHPEILYEDRVRVHLGSLVENLPKGWFKSKSYFTIDSEKDFNEQWDIIKQGKPDFIKVYLANSDDIGRTAPTTKYTLRKGLTPQLVKLIVQRAHREGFRVSAHVETRIDFVNAINANVDEVTHTPGFYLFSKDEISRYQLTEEDARLAAKKKVYVVTALLSRNLTEDESLFPLVEQTQASNLKLLYKHGVKIAIGSDHAQSPKDEVKALQKLGVFDNNTILRLWCQVTPETIFPGRKLGHFKNGYEASFIALDGNPSASLDNISKISLRVKQGKIINPK